VRRYSSPGFAPATFNPHAPTKVEKNILQIHIRNSLGLAEPHLNREEPFRREFFRCIMLFARRQLFRIMYNVTWTEIEAPDRATPHHCGAHSSGVVQVPELSLHFKRS